MPFDQVLSLAGESCIRRCQSSSFVPLNPTWNPVFLSAVIEFYLEWWVASNLAVQEACGATSTSSSLDSCQREGRWSSLPEERLGHVHSETAVMWKAQSCMYAKVQGKGRISLFILSNIFFLTNLVLCSALCAGCCVPVPSSCPTPACVVCVVHVCGVNSRTRATNPNPAVAISKALSHFVAQSLSEANLSAIWLVF